MDDEGRRTVMGLSLLVALLCAARVIELLPDVVRIFWKEHP